MKFVQISPITALLAACIATAGCSKTVVNEPFDNLDDWDDLSLAVIWGSHTGAVSAFKVVDGVVSLKREGPDSTVGFTGYDKPGTLRTFTVLDRRFPEPIKHAENVVTIDFRARWEKLDKFPQWGEKGRFVIFLTYDYPRGGLDLTSEKRVSDFSRPWWARPAYQLRIRSSDDVMGETLLMYGGGKTDLGEFEIVKPWWLPGFVAATNGVQPAGPKLPDYPANNWTKTPRGIASTQWRNYRYVVKPDAQEVWVDENDDGQFQIEELKASMPLPRTCAAPLYRYFETFEGIRLYWRGSNGPGPDGDPGQVYLDFITVTVSKSSLGPGVVRPLSGIEKELP
jgi:hypothetical protein